MKILLIISLQIILVCNLLNAQTKSEYKIVNKFSLEGDGGWDYLIVDNTTDKLFVSHSTMVQVVNETDGKMIATIANLKGVHGIALAYEFNKGFITSGKDSTVVVFDLKTYQILEKIKVTGANPDAILYDSFSKKVFIYNGRTSNATIIDAATNKIITTIPLDGKPEFSVSDGKGKVYVNIEDKSEISLINTSTLKVEQTWPIKPGKYPSGLAIDNTTHRLFSVCDNQLMVIVDAENGKIITTLPIGKDVDGAAFDPELKRIYSSNGDGTLTVVQEQDANTFKVLENITTQENAGTLALDTKTQHIYLSCAEINEAPEKTETNPHPKPTVKSGTFVVLDVALTNK